MVDETQKEETKPEDKESETPEGEPAEDTGDRKPVEAKSKVEEAAELAGRIDEGNKKLTENIERLEKLQAEEMLGGKSSAGQLPAKPPEQTPEEYAASLEDGNFNETNP